MGHRRLGYGGLVLLGLLGGCASTVQTSSGASYLAARPEWKPPAGQSVERAVFDAANIEPALKFPARIGLARITRGELATIPPEEADKWLALVKEVGPAYGEFVPISPLIADMAIPAQLTDQTGGQRDRQFGTVDRIRIGAARQHVDAVLIYEVATDSRDRGTPISLLDLTVLGAFLVPSRSIDGEATANAMLIDVRNGYPYGTATSTATQTGFVVSSGSYGRSRDLADQAAVDSVGKLTLDVGRMMARLKSELDSRELATLRASAPVMPAKRVHG